MKGVIMGLLNYMIVAVASFLIMAIDILIFFWLIQWLSRRSQNRWIQNFYRIGSPLLDTYYQSVRKQLRYFSHYPNSQKYLNVVAILELLGLRLILNVILAICL